MKHGSITKRYVKALIQIAQTKNQVEGFAEQLNTLSSELGQSELLLQTMDSPVIKLAQKKAIFSALALRLKLAPELINLAYILIDNKRFALLPFLNRVYQDKTDALLGRVRLQVKVSTPMDQAQEARLKTWLERSLGRKVLLQIEIDPKILGGLWVQVEDRVFDASLKSELERLKRNIATKAAA